jgi:hypothetical protein
MGNMIYFKIAISSNGQNCFILSQNVPKFELYKHKHELFNIYYGIFYELELLHGCQVMAIAHTGELKRAITPKWVKEFTKKLSCR